MPEHAHLKYLSFCLDAEERKVLAVFAPAGDVDSITLSDFKGAVAAAGFGWHKLNEMALQDATTKYADGNAFEIAVGEAIDGEFDICIDTGKLNAYLTCILPRGGTPVTLERILEEAKHKEITVELDLGAIEKALKEGGDSVLIASGRAAVNGVDGKFENLIPSAKERSPHLDEHGLADFRELGEILVVHKGDPLMRRIPATSGEPGLTLSDKEIPAKSGKDVVFGAKLDGAEFDPADENLLIAATDGCPVLLKDGVAVEPVYTVGDVDLHTGNIDFLGTVNVTGEIHSGMTVKASGDIHINGSVEGVILAAGGDIDVKGGIIGLTERPGEKSHHSMITCTGSCSANFTQNAHISAGNGIFIRDFAMQSELTAGHQIVIGDGSRKGNLIGGTARALMLVKAQIIGSPTRSKTLVIVGADQALHNRLTAITDALGAAAGKLLNVVKLLELAQANPGRLPAETVKAAEMTRDSINAEMAALRLDEAELEREIAVSHAAQIVAEKKFLEGVEIRFGLKRQTIIADREGGIFQLKDYELTFT